VNETLVTVAGNVAAEPRTRVTAAGVRVASFRLASTERRYNKELQAWRDGDTVYYTVTCWRSMAENAEESVKKGQPMIVHGRLRVSSYEKDGQARTSVEIEARSLGHDITWGVSEFRKAGPTAAADRALIGELAAEFDDEPVDSDIADEDAPPVDQDAA
jgi:single-strand DNA-binding protein